MKLSYRGASYESTSHTVDSIETGITAKFRGQTYQKSLPINLPVDQPAVALKYRGVSYTPDEAFASKPQTSPIISTISPALS